jgi:hypothetical protein
MSFEYMPGPRWHFGYPLVIGRTTAGACALLYRYLERKWARAENRCREIPEAGCHKRRAK